MKCPMWSSLVDPTNESSIRTWLDSMATVWNRKLTIHRLCFIFNSIELCVNAPLLLCRPPYLPWLALLDVVVRVYIGISETENLTFYKQEKTSYIFFVIFYFVVYYPKLNVLLFFTCVLQRNHENCQRYDPIY